MNGRIYSTIKCRLIFLYIFEELVLVVGSYIEHAYFPELLGRGQICLQKWKWSLNFFRVKISDAKNEIGGCVKVCVRLARISSFGRRGGQVMHFLLYIPPALTKMPIKFHVLICSRRARPPYIAKCADTLHMSSFSTQPIYMPKAQITMWIWILIYFMI